jgi:hypothetical protein
MVLSERLVIFFPLEHLLVFGQLIEKAGLSSNGLYLPFVRS